MAEVTISTKPFLFYTRLYLSELTGLRANTLFQLLDLIKTVPDSSIYYHSHIFLQQHHAFFPKPTNDFVYWVAENLGEDELAEDLASVDTFQFTNIKALREALIETIERFLQNNPTAKLRFARRDEGFHFLKSISFILPTKYIAHDLKEFLTNLAQVTVDSIYFHMFEARLRSEKGINDFSVWIEECVGDKETADKISEIDPYSYSLEGLQNTIIRIIKKRIL